MGSLLRKLLWMAGLLLTGWLAMVGLSFSGVYLMGFIGTGGREAGPELAGALVIALLGVASTWWVLRLGTRRRGPQARGAEESGPP